MASAFRAYRVRFGVYCFALLRVVLLCLFCLSLFWPTLLYFNFVVFALCLALHCCVLCSVGASLCVSFRICSLLGLICFVSLRFTYLCFVLRWFALPFFFIALLWCLGNWERLGAFSHCWCSFFMLKSSLHVPIVDVRWQHFSFTVSIYELQSQLDFGFRLFYL